VIGPARREDSGSIVAITGAAANFTPLERECVVELWSSYLAQGSSSGYEFLVYREESSQVLGYACYGPHPLTEGTYDLYWIAVLPEAGGRGIGRALLAEVERQVRRQGGRMLVIETSDTPAYAVARRLYETSGWVPQARIGDFYAPADSLVVFVKRLT
jgi:ribosomal protein S18 acetylase RimI-like enzyme